MLDKGLIVSDLLSKSSAFLRRLQKCPYLLSKHENHRDNCAYFCGLYNQGPCADTVYNLNPKKFKN